MMVFRKASIHPVEPIRSGERAARSFLPPVGALALCGLLFACEQPQSMRSGNTGSYLTDSDGDGVADELDKCANTGAGLAVNDFGCPDEDGDGVYDEDDQCPGTEPGQLVNSAGCDYVPTPTHAAGEIYRPRIVSVEDYESGWWRNRVGSLQQINCPGDYRGPTTPRILYPHTWSVELARVWAPPSLAVTVSWTSVTDDCLPLTYGIEVESNTPNTKKWQLERAFSKARLSTTSHEIDWPYPMRWGRFRVYATDANGQSSAPTDWYYFISSVTNISGADRFVNPHDV